jgi:Xaa-Pro aminopeptidase
MRVADRSDGERTRHDEDDSVAPDLPPAPPPDPDRRGRRARLRAALEEAGLDALWVTDLVNVRYLTGFTGSNGMLLVTRDPERDRLHTDGRYGTQAEQEVADLPTAIGRGGHLSGALDRLADSELRSIGFEATAVSWDLGERIQRAAEERDLHAAPTRGMVERLRETKDAGELAALRAACAITDAALQLTLERLEPGRTEGDVARSIERTMVELGAEAPAFETIVASGPNSARPHHRPTARALQSGELVKIDVGARFAGYHADTTRTVALGEPQAHLRDVHDLVRRAQRAGVEAAVAGTSAGDVDAACRELISAAGHGDDFAHGTGHGVGLQIHERPAVGPGSGATLGPRMTVTIEPGVYLAGIGGVRIEDTVVIREQGPPDVLTRTPRELLVL